MTCCEISRVSQTAGKSGAPGGIRTPGLMIRSHLLYPAELQAPGETLPLYEWHN